MKFSLLPVLAAMAVGTFLVPSAKAADTANDKELSGVLDGLQKIYEKSKNFNAIFEQSFKSPHGGMKTESSGKIFFSKPGKVRWEYEKPRKRLFIARDNNLWIYSPEDNQVMTSKKFSQTQLTVALSFLYGSGKLNEEFDAKIVKKYDTGWTLKLLPKKENPQLTALYLDISNASFLVTAVDVEDSLGNRNRFKFEKIGLNTEMPDSLFTFKPPADAEVVPVPEGFLR
jgi:outer membrane lipoprotein carrier protein